MAADEICPPLEEIEQFISRGSARAGLVAHVGSCSACRGMVQRLRDTHALQGDTLGSGGAGSTPAAIPGYPIVAEIHRGGQGVVFEALQESTQRRVAVKVLREGAFADAADRARFEREVRILGQLRHPNIVAIHDSGVVDGRAYFVMDYIPGQALDAWMEMRRGPAGLKETLRLFRTICEALNIAHLRGIIHRDLKPSNIRVDPDGQPHILDFGLAKVAESFQFPVPSAESGPLAVDSAVRAAELEAGNSKLETPSYTETGQFLGSLPWASPEQAGGMASDLDIRTDVYSLGVILFQALTGKFPYDVFGPLRIVLDRIVTAEPLRPRALNPHLDDELETIVLRCLNKDRERRYQSAGELGRDLARYLAGEPIAAKRDSFGYVLRKQLAKHRLPVAFGAALLVLLIVGLVVSLTLWRSAAAGQRAALVAASRATELSEFLSGLLIKADPLQQGRGDVTVREVVDEFAARLDSGDLHAQPETVAALRQVIGGVYDSLGAYTDAERELRASLAERLRLFGENDPQTAESQNALGLYLLGQRRMAEAETLLEAARATVSRSGAEDAQHLATVLLNLSVVRRARQDSGSAERLLRECRALNTQDDTQTAAGIQLASVLAESGRTDEAAALFREALAERRTRYPGPHPQVAQVLNDLGLLLQSRGEFDEAQRCIDEAIEIWRKLFPNGHAVIGVGLNTLGLLRCARGDAAGGEAAHRESLEVLRRLLPRDHPFILIALSNLINAQKAQEKFAEAEKSAQEALAVFRTAPNRDDASFAKLLYAYGDVLYQMRRAAEAESTFDECLAIRQRIMPNRWEPHYTKFALARTLTLQKLYPDAEQLLRDAYDGLQSHPPDRPGRIADVIEAFIVLYERWDRPDQAAEWRTRLGQWQASTQSAASQPV